MTTASGRKASGGAAPLLRRRHPRRRSSTARKPPPAPPHASHRPGQPIGYLAARGTPYQKKYLSKKLTFCLLDCLPPVLAVSLVILLVPVLWAIGNHTLHVVQMHIEQANLTSLTNSSFSLSLSGSTSKAGIFPATIYFRQPLDVYWMTPPPYMTQVRLGSFPLGRVNVASGHGKVIQSTSFEIADPDAFGQFTAYLASQPRFTWRLVCENTHVEAFGFLPFYKNLEFRKHINFNGINNFQDVQLVDFQLPGNDPLGGITFQALTTLVNPSPFAVQLGNLNLDLYYKDLYMGPGVTLGPVNITSGPNTIVLVGRLLPWNDQQRELDMLSDVFTKYLNGETVPVVAKGVSTTQANGELISWLSHGIKALAIKVPLQRVPPIAPIKSIQIDEFSIVFSEDKPWQPTAYSNALKALIGLPFGFQLDIVETRTALSLMYNNSLVGAIEGAYSNSTLRLDVVNQAFTSGVMDLTLPPSPLTIGGNQTAERLWSTYEDVLVFDVNTSTRLQGVAHALTDTPVGRILLSPIHFDVESGLTGLQGLSKYPTTITAVDLVGGTRDALNLSINTTIINPSNLNLSTGTVQFRLVNNKVIGNVTMPNLHLDLGANNVTAQTTFDPRAAPEGQLTLDRFVSGLDTKLYINGYDGSSPIPSLNPTLSKLRLNTILPGLKQIISEGNLIVPAYIDANNMTSVRVSIANPFTSALDISSIVSAPVYNNLTLGTINTNLSPPIHAAGHAVTVSEPIPLALNTHPKFLVDLVLQLAQASNTSLGPWPPWLRRILAMPGDASTQVKATPGGDASSCPANGAFDLQGAMLKALKGLAVNIPLLTKMNVGDYETMLNFSQAPVPIRTDNTSLYLLGPAGAPLIQQVVDEAGLSFAQGNITNVSDAGFVVHLNGTLETNVPVNALITFPDPLEIRWQGDFIATISLPPICTIPGQGVPVLLTSGQVNITNQEAFTKFATFILHNDHFDWEISSPNVTVIALGVTFTHVNLVKNVTFQSFNGLPGVVTNNFEVPAEGPDFLNISVAAAIPSPASLGIELNTAKFRLLFNETEIGTAQSEDLTLPPNGLASTILKGELVQQTMQTGLDNVGVLFTNFLQGQNLSLSVQGMEVVTPYQNGRVAWLSDAFATLQLDVVLMGKMYPVIFAITLVDLTLSLHGDPAEVAYNIPVSSNQTLAMYANPFHFTLAPVMASVEATVLYENVSTAQLNLPMLDAGGEASTGPERQSPLALSFHDQRLQSLNNEQFTKFLAAATDTELASFELKGAATVRTDTHIGQLLISNIDFSVPSELTGINSFNHEVPLRDVILTNSTADYLVATLGLTLYNPSNITLLMEDDLYIPVFYKGLALGRVLVASLALLPGSNFNPATFYYGPPDPSDPRGMELIQHYITPVNNGTGGTNNPSHTPIDVGGVPEDKLGFAETPYESLVPALHGMHMPTLLPGQPKRLIVELDIFIDVIPALLNRKGTAKLIVYNSLLIGLNVERIDCDVWKAGEEGEGNPDFVRAVVHQDIEPNAWIEAGDTVSIPLNFTLTRDLLFSLDLLPQNLSIAAIIRVTVEGGYILFAWPYQVYDIYTTYAVSVLGIPINITSTLDLLPQMLSVLSPEQVSNELAPALAQLPQNSLQMLYQGLNALDPLAQLACSAIPILQGLPIC